MASWNPAQMLGMPHLASVTAGHPANFNLYDQAGEHAGSIVRGQFIPSR
jgi:N-acetylglucosamine-6-phosphate deacetylase